jgi:hypothetical protein
MNTANLRHGYEPQSGDASDPVVIGLKITSLIAIPIVTAAIA